MKCEFFSFDTEQFKQISSQVEFIDNNILTGIKTKKLDFLLPQDTN